MKICITGALGHIGSGLIRNLRLTNLERVHLVDNMYKQRYVSLIDLPAKVPFVFHELDIGSSNLENVIKDSDVVVHLAAISDAESSLDQRDLVEKVNISGLKNVVNLCGKYGAKLFFPSTTSVYSGVNVILDESCDKRNIVPQNPYAESKLRGENFIHEYAKKQNLKYLIFRIGTIFGYSLGMRFNTAVNKFILQAASGQKITVWKTAMKQKRPYCDLIDCIAALNMFIENDDFDGETYNVVTDNYSVEEIITGIMKYVPGLQVESVDSRIMNTLSYGASNQKTKLRGLKYRGNLDRSTAETLRHLAGVNSLVNKNI